MLIASALKSSPVPKTPSEPSIAQYIAATTSLKYPLPSLARTFPEIIPVAGATPLALELIVYLFSPQVKTVSLRGIKHGKQHLHYHKSS